MNDTVILFILILLCTGYTYFNYLIRHTGLL